jgi:hypothetical protein
MSHSGGGFPFEQGQSSAPFISPSKLDDARASKARIKDVEAKLGVNREEGK